jgi:hypothetical protein
LAARQSSHAAATSHLWHGVIVTPRRARPVGQAAGTATGGSTCADNATAVFDFVRSMAAILVEFGETALTRLNRRDN